MLTFFQTLEEGMNLSRSFSRLVSPTTHLDKGTNMYSIEIQRQFALTRMFMESVIHPVIFNIHIRSVFSSFLSLYLRGAYLTVTLIFLQITSKLHTLKKLRLKMKFLLIVSRL